MAADTPFGVEVTYALPHEQIVVALEVAPGTTVEEAIRLSELGERHPEIENAGTNVGIYGRRVPPNTMLAAGDRVEIYRPLTADPKQARRRRAARRR